MKIAYLTSMYPDVSHTFILREVRALRACGMELVTFSVRRPGNQNILGTDAREEAAKTRWLVPSRLGHLASTLLWSLGTRPALVGGTLFEAVLGRGMTAGRRFKWLCYFVEALLLAYWLINEAFDHLHCHFGNSGSSTGMLAARLAGIPFSMTCHGSELREMRKYRLAEKVAQAAFVACVSQHGRAQLMSVSQPEHWHKLHLVRCGVPKTAGSPTRVSDSPSRILCVGRLSAEKGQLVLLDALAELCSNSVGFRCTFVGDGSMRPAIEARAKKLRLTASLTFTGALAPNRVAELYRSADVVVLASFHEGLPVVLMEAMEYRRPVVATRVGGVPELVEHGKSGLVVPPGDAKALAKALKRILDDREFAWTLGEAGQRRVREEFNIEASAGRLSGLFEHVASGRTEDVPVTARKDELCPPPLTVQDS